MPPVEIIWPAGTAGPLDQMLGTHANGLVYHLCFAAMDLAASIPALEDAGLALFRVVRPKPAMLFNGLFVSFYMMRGVGLVEFIDGVPPPDPRDMLPIAIL